jgi:hypothetical protein
MKWYVLATAILFCGRVALFDYTTHDLSGALGVGTGMLFWGVVPAALYWFFKGKRVENGKMKTARVMFWCSFVVPLLLMSIPKNVQ